MPNGVPEPIERRQPPEIADERTALTGRLDFLRATVVNKVAGLADADARRTVLPPSQLTAAGLVKHLTGIERFWFSIDFADTGASWPWHDDDPHGNFRLSDDDTLPGIVDAYLEECETSRAIVRSAELDDRARGEGMTFDLRYALLHVIEETARHCGHLDLIREQIDGQTGE
jgi:hypothetical protein